MGESSAPTNESMDALFDGSRGALVKVRAPMTIDPARGPVLLEVPTAELAELRSTLSIVESDERFHCMCKGDYAIELRGLLFAKGTISFHHGVSLRLAGWSSDAKLADGPALFRFLAKRGIKEPLEAYERGLVAQAEADAVRERWLAAKPALDALGKDAAAARALFRWLSHGQGRWSGYPAYEQEPMKLLEAFPSEVLIEAACASDSSEAEVRGATRYFGSHEVVSFRKSLLGELPESLFERGRPIWQSLPLETADIEDIMARFEHLVRVAADRRAKKTRIEPYKSGELTVFGESVDGPLSGLAALADGTLLSVDVKRILRFAPGRVEGVLVAEASESFVVLSAGAGASGDRVAWATMNASEVFENGERIAERQHVPVEITSAAPGIAWISRDAPGGHQVVTPKGVLAKVKGIHSLTSDATHVYFIEGGFSGGTIHRVAWAGGKVEKVVAIPDLEYSVDASPRYSVSGHELFVAIKKEVRAIELETGKSRVLLRAPHPVHAVRADETHIALVMGEEDEDWFLGAAPRRESGAGAGGVRKLASFRRAPYHKHPLLIARGHAVTLSNDRIIAALLA